MIPKVLSNHPFSTFGSIVRHNQETSFLRTLYLNIPSVEDLDLVSSVTFDALRISGGFFPDGRSEILVRKEYKDLWDIIEKDRLTPGRGCGGIVLTGQPGIGKIISSPPMCYAETT